MNSIIFLLTFSSVLQLTSGLFVGHLTRNELDTNLIFTTELANVICVMNAKHIYIYYEFKITTEFINSILTNVRVRCLGPTLTIIRYNRTCLHTYKSISLKVYFFESTDSMRTMNIFIMTFYLAFVTSL